MAGEVNRKSAGIYQSGKAYNSAGRVFGKAIANCTVTVAVEVFSFCAAVYFVAAGNAGRY